MISSLDITNFQSHANTSLAFSHGVNVLVGSSDSGKTAILRSLYWILRNRPLGSAFIRHGQGKATVKLSLEDGAVIRREKGKQTNRYIVDGEPLEALGSDVPRQVRDVLGIDDITIHRQLDGPFLVLDPPGKVASAINTVTRLEDAEAIVGELSSQARQAKSEVKFQEEVVDRLTLELAEYEWLQNYCQLVKRADRLAIDIRAGTIERDAIVGVAERLTIAKQELAALPNVSVLLSVVDRVDEVVAEIKRLRVLRDSVRDLLVRLVEVVTGLKDLLDIDRLDYVKQCLEDIHSDYRLLDDKFYRLSAWLWADHNIQGQLTETIDELTRVETEFAELVQSLNVCPMCGQKLDNELRARIG